jgi:hypothetical protein
MMHSSPSTESDMRPHLFQPHAVAAQLQVVLSRTFMGVGIFAGQAYRTLACATLLFSH